MEQMGGRSMCCNVTQRCTRNVYSPIVSVCLFLHTCSSSCAALFVGVCVCACVLRNAAAAVMIRRWSSVERRILPLH